MSLSLAQKVRGGLLGVAAGDALGAPLEFMSVSEIFARYGVIHDMVESPERGLKRGETTDDTAMTLAVANGIAANREDPVEEVGKCLLAWYYRGPKGIGNQVRRVIDLYESLRNWPAAAQQVAGELNGFSAGNGCLVRTVPVSFAYASKPEMMLEMSERICRMTHYDGQAVACCRFYNDLIWRLMEEDDKAEAFRQSLKALKAYRDKRKSENVIVDDMDKVIYTLANIVQAEKAIFQTKGYVVDTLAAAVWCWLNGDSFERIVLSAVNLGGDTDTVAAVAGGLAGTEYGLNSIPERWLNALVERDKIEEAAVKVVGLANK